MEADTLAPTTLWHYTTAPGFRGIVGSGHLWATDAEFLNDAQELRFGRNLIRDEFEEALRRAGDSQLLDEFDNPVGWDPQADRRVMLSAALSVIDRADPERFSAWDDVFVTCFCEKGDLLSQWRGYAGGPGFALGFDVQALRTIELLQVRAADSTVKLEGGLRQVRYGRDAVERELPQLMERFEKVTAHPGVHGEDIGRRVVTSTLAAVKDSAFEEEQEWRYVVVGCDERAVQVREGSLGLVPFMEIPYGDALREVRLGPGGNIPVRMKATRRYLASVGLNHVEVSTSEVPFRS